MIKCNKCSTLNDSDAINCAKCNSDLLSMIDYKNRFKQFIIAILFFIFGTTICLTIKNFEMIGHLAYGQGIYKPSDLSKILFYVSVALFSVVLGETGRRLRGVFGAIPIWTLYLTRARRHIEIDISQTIKDLNASLKEFGHPAAFPYSSFLYSSFGAPLPQGVKHCYSVNAVREAILYKINNDIKPLLKILDDKLKEKLAQIADSFLHEKSKAEFIIYKINTFYKTEGIQENIEITENDSVEERVKKMITQSYIEFEGNPYYKSRIDLPKDEYILYRGRFNARVTTITTKSIIEEIIPEADILGRCKYNTYRDNLSDIQKIYISDCRKAELFLVGKKGIYICDGCNDKLIEFINNLFKILVKRVPPIKPKFINVFLKSFIFLTLTIPVILFFENILGRKKFTLFFWFFAILILCIIILSGLNSLDGKYYIGYYEDLNEIKQRN